MQRLTRREILKTLKRQSIYGLSKIKAETKQFESYWEKRMAYLARGEEAARVSCGHEGYRERTRP